MMMITTLIPATNLLLNERASLQQKNHMVNELHDELHFYLRGAQHNLPYRFFKTVDGSKAEFLMTSEDELLKGCVTWSNAKNKTEEFCLYGYPEQ